MARACSLDLRKRVVAAVASGQSCRWAAKTFVVSVASVVKWSQSHRAIGNPAGLKMSGRRPYAPGLAPGDIVVMDNLGSNKSRTVRSPIRAAKGQGLLPVRLLARPQSSRTDLRQNEDPVAKSRRRNHQ
jgi:Transposase